MTSRHHKNAATAARRTASSLRGMAETCHDAEPKGILLAAARVSEQIAKQRNDQYAQAKREEDAYKAAMLRLTPEAIAKIKADWPMATNVQRIAIIAAHSPSSSLKYVMDSVLNPPSWSKRSPGEILSSCVQDAINDAAQSIAYSAYRGKTTVAVTICDFARRVERMYSDTAVKNFAALLDSHANCELAEASC